MSKHSLSISSQPITALRSAIVKPAHISGLGLGLCLILALATPPSSSHKANPLRATMPVTAAPADNGRAAAWTKDGHGNLDIAQIIQALGDSERLVGYFSEMGYRLDTLRIGVGTVPRLYLASLPNDLPQVESAETRKTVFIKAVLPSILRANEEVVDRRLKLEAMSGKTELGQALSDSE